MQLTNISCLMPFLPCKPGTAPHPGNHIRYKVEKLLLDRFELDSASARATVDLTWELMAMKHVFPHMLDEKNTDPALFDLHAPLRNLQVGRNNIAHLLQHISPGLSDENIVNGIRKIVKHIPPCKRADPLPLEAMIMAIDPDSAPVDWPVKAMLYALRIGHWDKIDLTDAQLIGADLRGVQWQGANLRNVNMQSAMVNHANLEDADMTAVNARGASFIGTHFAGATLQDTNFQGAILDRADGITCYPGTNFTEAQMNRIHMSLQKSEAEHARFREGQLLALSTIDSQFDELYNKAVLKLFGISLCTPGGLPKVNFFTTQLLASKRSWADSTLRKIIEQCWLPSLLELWNFAPKRDGEPQLEEVLTFLSEAKPNLDWPRYCGAINQLITATDPAHYLGQQNEVQSQFFRHPDIAPVAAAIEAQEPGLSRICSIFISPDRALAIVYEKTELQAMASGQGSPYSGYQFRHDQYGKFQNEVIRNIKEIEACAVPLARYNIAPLPQAAINLITCIFDQSIYKNKFIDALGCKTLPPPMEDPAGLRIALTDDLPLMQHLMQFCYGAPEESNFCITTEHAQLLWQIFNSTIDPLAYTKANQARMLLCLGTLFVQYSSAALFGIEKDSLLSLRTYAAACLNTAHYFDPALLGRVELFKDALLGLRRAPGLPQCTAALSSRLTTLIRKWMATDAVLKTCFTALYPSAWK
ncbi:MAG: sopA 7 [Herbaspirillum sp.]|nr:sopA 7 [Herbaspirillum sp.]